MDTFRQTNDWVLDPFAGVGSTMLAGLKNNRNVVSIEKANRYIQIGTERIQMLLNGHLLARSITKPIYDHTQSKLSQKPLEFKHEV